MGLSFFHADSYQTGWMQSLNCCIFHGATIICFLERHLFLVLHTETKRVTGLQHIYHSFKGTNSVIACFSLIVSVVCSASWCCFLAA